MDEKNSPYFITDSVQIPANITLTIEPGVSISKLVPGGPLFLLNGTLIARGTATDRIVFDGGGISDFFNPKNYTGETFLDLDFATINNGKAIWPPSGYEQNGYFNLRHSQVSNVSDYSYVWYPKHDVAIEFNVFNYAGGFSIGTNGNVTVHIQNNTFVGKSPGSNFVIQNWANYEQSKTIVKYNSFLNMTGIILKLPSGYNQAAMIGTQNYWGTQDSNIIAASIFDKTKDIACAGYITFLPILTEPDPRTPNI